MKKYFSNLMIFSAILTLALASVFCCDFTSKRTAKIEKSVPACHQAESAKSTPVKSECTCCITKKIQADPLVKFSFAPLKETVAYASFDGLMIKVSAVKTSFHLTRLDGPPGPVSETPLYLQSRSIRI